jgi:myo-inositol-1(or 4)-monophosphatase
VSQAHLDLAIRAATAAGEKLRAGFRHEVSVLSAKGKDIKTREDLEAEQAILALLGPTGIPVLTEETGLHGKRDDAAPMWVIDPLDGTLNYARGLPLCCVSIALWRGREPILGVVNEFLHGRMYRGLIGQGAWCNEAPLRVSGVADVSQAVIATGFPAAANFESSALMDFVRQVQRFKKVRLLGSAALSLANVAAGAVDAYGENGIQFWDVAAGLALVQAAGGNFQMSVPDERWRSNVSAGNGRLQFT